MVLFSLPFFMDYATVFSCTLIECIESIKSDVKKKITPRARATDTPKSPDGVREEIFFRAATIIHPLHAKNSNRTHLSIALHTQRWHRRCGFAWKPQFSQFNFSPPCASII